MLKIFIFIFSFFLLNSSFAQELEGKWILKEAGEMGNRSYQGLYLLSFEGDTGKLFIDLEMKDLKSEFTVDGFEFLGEGVKFDFYKFYGNDLLRVYDEEMSDGHILTMTLDFVRLKPTITNLSALQIEGMVFEEPADGHKPAIKTAFNTEMMDEEFLNMLKIEMGQILTLDKLDETYFVTVNFNNKILGSLPLNEVTEEYLIYQFTEDSIGEVKAYRIE